MSSQSARLLSPVRQPPTDPSNDTNVSKPSDNHATDINRSASAVLASRVPLLTAERRTSLPVPITTTPAVPQLESQPKLTPLRSVAPGQSSSAALSSPTRSAYAAVHKSPAAKPAETAPKDSVPTPQIHVPKTAPSAHDSTGEVAQVEQPGRSSLAAAPNARTPRNVTGLVPTLETVEEGDQGPESLDKESNLLAALAKTEDSSRPQAVGLMGGEKDNQQQEHGSELVRARVEERAKAAITARTVSAPPAEPTRKKSSTPLLPNKVRSSNEGSSQLMTVETETVSSIPQTSTATSINDRGGNSRADGMSTLKTKPSVETIRPKKEKKKPARKPPISGAHTTKADIFEAKVASAVDEDSSDSDETFVYESNPPEPRSRQLRHHSRTPSITSMHSLVDRKGGSRVPGYHHDGNHGPTGKRSMKFASSHASSSLESEGGERDSGTVRASRHKHVPTSDMQYQHIGIFGRAQGDHFESESPYSHASRLRSATGFNSRHSSKPLSSDPNSPTRLKTPTKRGGTPPFWVDDEAADDERAPLVGSLRSQRSRNFRRSNNSNVHYVEYHADDIPRRRVSRLTGCLIMALTVILAILIGGGLVFATTKPLYDVDVLRIQDVLASEQEIMLDLVIQAVNPNILAVSVWALDVNIFAKSRHTSTPNATRTRSPPTPTPTHALRTRDNVDEGTDPIDDPDGDPQTMLLGRILHFDSALIFDASPIFHTPSNSTGELRLPKPGTSTGAGAGGAERWEHILQFPFELIVRGIVKYQLPLSGHTTSASIGASVVVHPEDGIDGRGRMRLDGPRCAWRTCDWRSPVDMPST